MTTINTSVFTRGSGKRIAMVDLRYPYGWKKIYLSGSLFTVASRFWNAGCDVEILDFNIDNYHSARAKKVLTTADIIGVSVIGAPYIPAVIKFCKRMKALVPDTPVLLGGQFMMAFTEEQFQTLFNGTNAILAKTDLDLVPFGFPVGSMPEWYEVSLQPILERLGDERLKTYLLHEMPLVVSQGCKYNCSFCGAAKKRPEKFKDEGCFATDFEFMAKKAKEFGINELEFYATNLDFFQNPEQLAGRLRIVAEVREQVGISTKLRALACMSSFLESDAALPNLKELLDGAGFWCVGFGVDGPTEEIWKTLHKGQNVLEDVPKVLARTAEMGLTTEILMIMGDKNYDRRLLVKTVHFCYGLIIDYPHTLLRLHINKVLTGSDDWKAHQQYVQKLLDRPRRFFNLDILSLATRVTHPDGKQRRQVNFAYFATMLPLRFFGRCISSSIMPQGERSLVGLLSQLANPFMPYDR